MAAEDRITTPRGSTIEAVDAGHYRICDAGNHCQLVESLAEAWQLVQRAELHHRPLDQLQALS